MQKIVKLDYLLHFIWRPGLLAIAEGGVSYDHLIRWVQWLDFMVKVDFTNIGIGKYIPVKLRLFGFFQRYETGLMQMVQ